MKNRFLYIIISLVVLSTACTKDYLNIVPEGTPSMDNAFSNRTNAEKFLYTCYSYLPNFCDPSSAPGFLAGDEFWTYENQNRMGYNCWNIGRGDQNSNDPYMDYWEGQNGGSGLWIAIRDCNIFLENISRPQDLGEFERTRWVAEVKFLKAFYHYWLFQCYGPIPIADKNLEVDASIDQVRVYRDPVDDVVTYISNLLDECIPDLPDAVIDEGTELGRITKSIAYSVKAKLLVLAASDLFNGNADYVNYVDKRGVQLFPSTYDKTKWEKAAAACKEAIEFAESQGHVLFTFNPVANVSDYTKVKLSISESVCDLWNKEIIWGASGSNTNTIQTMSFPKVSSTNNYWGARSCLSPTLTVAETFYSDNGVPIEEDKSYYWSTEYANRYSVTTAPAEYPNQYNVEAGSRVAVLHLHREPRFYANLGFNRGKWYVQGLSNDTTAVYNLHNYRTEYSGLNTNEDYSITGYFARKICSYRSTISTNSLSMYRYAFPIIRLSDLYLLYAEALNESMDAPSQEVYDYIDAVRARSGLDGVKDSWTNYSINPSKPNTKNGMRSIIRRERMCELALEGQKFWDMRRWKQPLNRFISGWNIMGNNEATFYNVVQVYDRGTYNYKDYFWPIELTSIQKNPNLMQSPGW